MYSHHAKRIAYLKKLNYNDSQIHLFFNPNSKTKDDETGKWQSGSPKPGTNPGQNDKSTYPNSFTGIPGKAAVVVSADPFFYATRGDLIDAANNWLKGGQRHICYPLQDYEQNDDGTKKPTAAKSILYGPRLYDAYFALGQVVANYLTQPPSYPTLVLLPMGNPVPAGP
jgi:hypothetical protein